MRNRARGLAAPNGPTHAQGRSQVPRQAIGQPVADPYGAIRRCTASVAMLLIGDEADRVPTELAVKIGLIELNSALLEPLHQLASAADAASAYATLQ